MKRLILVKMIFLVACTSHKNAISSSKEISSEQHESIAGLRQYCKACHGLSDLKFLTSDDDNQELSFLLSNDSPLSHKPWSGAIISVLQWPDNSPPEVEARFASEARYMPVGFDRVSFAAATTSNGKILRESIIELLNSGVEK